MSTCCLSNINAGLNLKVFSPQAPVWIPLCRSWYIILSLVAPSGKSKEQKVPRPRALLTMPGYIFCKNNTGVKVQEILNTESPLMQYWKLPFPYTWYRKKNLLNTNFSTYTENFHPW